jgi:hypothetical protein
MKYRIIAHRLKSGPTKVVAGDQLENEYKLHKNSIRTDYIGPLSFSLGYKTFLIVERDQDQLKITTSDGEFTHHNLDEWIKIGRGKKPGWNEKNTQLSVVDVGVSKKQIEFILNSKTGFITLKDSSTNGSYIRTERTRTYLSEDNLSYYLHIESNKEPTLSGRFDRLKVLEGIVKGERDEVKKEYDKSLGDWGELVRTFYHHPVEDQLLVEGGGMMIQQTDHEQSRPDLVQTNFSIILYESMTMRRLVHEGTDYKDFRVNRPGPHQPFAERISTTSEQTFFDPMQQSVFLKSFDYLLTNIQEQIRAIESSSEFTALAPDPDNMGDESASIELRITMLEELLGADPDDFVSQEILDQLVEEKTELIGEITLSLSQLGSVDQLGDDSE